MKQETRQTKQTAEETIDTVNSTIELSQKTVEVMLDGAVKTAGMAESYMRGMVQVGLDSQEAGVAIARNYFDSMARINRQWLNLFSTTGEKAINTVGDNVKKPISDALKNGAEAVENAASGVKQAAK
jgi:hypothetical protein